MLGKFLTPSLAILWSGGIVILVTKDQATLLNYALGVVHRELSSNMESVADDKLDDFMDNVKWTRKHAISLNEKFSLTPEV